MRDIYDNNLKYIKTKNKNLYDALQLCGLDNAQDRFFFEMSKNKEIIPYIYTEQGKRSLNSTYNPSKEAYRLVEPYFGLTDNAYLLMYGMGNGAFARAFLDNNHNNNALVIYEPDAELFVAILNNIDITDIIADSRVYVFVNGLNKDEFGIFLCEYTNALNEKHNRYLSIPVYEQLYSEQYEEYRQIIREKFEYYRIQINTTIAMGAAIGEAELRNMKYLPNCISGADYVNYFPKDVPAIIVAAGPSLAKNVELLKQAKGRAVIIVVDAAAKAVYNRGITPDFVITVDVHKKLEVFDNFKYKGFDEVYMLADMSANPAVFDLVKPRNIVFYTTDSDNIRSLFREQGTDIGEIFAGGSVALDAMAFAVYAGFKRIIMIGQDLAMTGNRQYADGRAVNENTEFNAETMWIKDIYGNDILTKKDYYSFIKNIEDLAYEHQDIDFIDATEGGARKNNTRIMTFQDAISRYCVHEYDIDGLIASVPRRFAGEQKIIIENKLKDMLNEVEKFALAIDNRKQEAYNYITLLKNNKNYDNTKLTDKIKDMQRSLDAKYANVSCWILIKKFIAKEVYDYEAAIYDEEADIISEGIRLFENSCRLYDAIIRAALNIEGIISELKNEL